MSVDVLSEIVIRKPCHEVAAFAANPDNAPAWYVNIKSVDWKTEPPLQIGTKVVFFAKFLNRRLVYTYEVVDYVANERMVMRTDEGPFPMETSYSWENSSASSTLMTLRNRGAPSGFSRLFAPFLAMAMRRANRHDLARLKELLEGVRVSARSTERDA